MKPICGICRGEHHTFECPNRQHIHYGEVRPAEPAVLPKEPPPKPSIPRKPLTPAATSRRPPSEPAPAPSSSPSQLRSAASSPEPPSLSPSSSSSATDPATETPKAATAREATEALTKLLRKKITELEESNQELTTEVARLKTEREELLAQRVTVTESPVTVTNDVTDKVTENGGVTVTKKDKPVTVTKKGRPSSGNALSAAEKQRGYRARKRLSD